MTIHNWCDITCFNIVDIENCKVQKDGKTYLSEGYYDMLKKFGDEELDEVFLNINENRYIDLLFMVAKKKKKTFLIRRSI